MFNQDQADERVRRKRKKIRTKEERRTMYRWILVIMLVAFLIIFFLNTIIPLVENLEIKDSTYAPRDIERKYHELDKKVRRSVQD
ncbi:MAG: hypothetical protein N2572_07040 [Syntrophales bacterium]|nr:hypothetical protein [Syntrophales bacterium]